MTEPTKIEYRFDMAELRSMFESHVGEPRLSGMDFRIEPHEGGSQRDPYIVGLTITWYKVKKHEQA